MHLYEKPDRDEGLRIAQKTKNQQIQWMMDKADVDT